jgi:type I restriction enzyme R subunit
MHKPPIPFRGFDDHGDVRMYYHGLLPHWRQAGCTYFVTFRLADSIPRDVLREIEHQRTQWLAARGIDSRNPNWHEALGELPLLERRLYEKLLGRLANESLGECHGCCALRDPAAALQVASALEHFHGGRVWTGDYVVLPNHVHALLTPQPGCELEELLQSIKSFSARQINRSRGESGTFWQRESYDHIVRDLQQLAAFQEYIAANPAKARLRPDEYVHSRASYVLAEP